MARPIDEWTYKDVGAFVLSFAGSRRSSAVLEAALDVFSVHGFRGSTIDQIAEAAGMSKPNLLYYFGRKEDVHKALIERLLHTWLGPLEEMDNSGDPIPEIRSYIHRKLEMAREALAAVGLDGKGKRLPHQISGGEKERTAIARALINDPAFIIADEPTAHLDTDLARQFLGIVARLKSEGKTVLMGSHDPLLIDSAAVDRVVKLRYGRLDGGGGQPC